MNSVVIMYHKLGLMIGKTDRVHKTDSKGGHVVLENPFVIDFSPQGIQMLPVTELFDGDELNVYDADYHGQIADAQKELAAEFEKRTSLIELPPQKSIITG